MNRILTYFSFILSALVVVGVFITATTYIQLAIAVVLYPLLICFAFKAFPRKSPTKVIPVTIIEPAAVESVEKAEAAKRDGFGIADIDKRVFLSLIGGVGLSIFLFSLFSKKGEGLFFKSLPQSDSVSLEDTQGHKIDPAQNQPTDGYKICEIDEDVVSFYGFTNKDGAWFVMREDTNVGSFRYSRGENNFPDSWTNRANLKYDYFNNIF